MPTGLSMPMMPGMGSGSGSGMGMGSGPPGGGRMLFGGPRDGDGPNLPGGGTPGTVTNARIIDNARLVELSIYAIASIYERFPARIKDTTTPPVTTPPSKN